MDVDRALDEIVSERHVSPRSAVSLFSLVASPREGPSAHNFCREVDGLEDAVAVAEMIAMITLVTA